VTRDNNNNNNNDNNNTFLIMRDVPSMAVNSSESIECFPGIIVQLESVEQYLKA
jgi:hypothetical protein